MAFGKAAETPAQGSEEVAERWEKRDLKIVDGDEKVTGGGKVYWRVKDSNGFWYSVWEDTVKIRLELAAEKGESVPCAIQITPGKNGGKPFYTIAGTDAMTDGLIEGGKAKAQAKYSPGGPKSEFGKRMHPDDALRVTLLATLDRAIEMVKMTLGDKPEKTSYDTYVKAKVMEYNTFLSEIVNQPKTPTPKPDVPSPAPDTRGLEKVEGEPADDDGIPF